MRRSVSIALALSLFAVLTGAGTAKAANNPLVLSDKLVTTLSNSPVSEVRQANGTVVDQWDVNGITVTASGPAHMVVTTSLKVKNGRYGLTISATLPAINKNALLAMPNVAGDYIWASPCVGANISGGWYRACDVIYMVYSSGGNWYLGDSEEISGDEGWPWELYELIVDSSWKSGNTEVQWSPNSAESVGSCKQVSVGVSDYASISETWDVCPNGYGPYSTTHLGRDFGAYWISDGGESQWEGVDATDIVHSPPTAEAIYTLTAYDGYSFL